MEQKSQKKNVFKNEISYAELTVSIWNSVANKKLTEL